MSDKLVFDLSQEIEGSPNVFIRKDWLNILDNQNQNYNNNQSVIDTSQLSNSNKWMNYREAYFSIPFLITLAATDSSLLNSGTVPNWNQSDFAITRSTDYAYGLKNWFGQIIHSFTLDYNGTTIIQQTPYINMWNSFKLMTSLSYNDLLTQGDVIGFYPDDATSWEMNLSAPIPTISIGTTSVNMAAGFANGTGVCNNSVESGNGQFSSIIELNKHNTYNSGFGNEGLIKRIQNINFNGDAIPSTTSSIFPPTLTPAILVTSAVNNANAGPTYGSLLATNVSANSASFGSMTNIWKSYIQNKSTSLQQTAVIATVYLKHVHSFFNMVPLLKGVFMKMTMNLNNTSSTFYCSSTNLTAGAAAPTALVSMVCSSVSNSLGGVNPIMIAGPKGGSIAGGSQTVPATTTNNVWGGCSGLFPSAGTVPAYQVSTAGYTINLSVGATCLNSTLAGIAGIQSGSLSKSIYLYIPAYTFNPPFEQAYLSQPTKIIKYTDLYQYQVLSVASNAQFNNLLTNGIANIKSILILPFYSGSSQLGTINTAYQTVNATQSAFAPVGTLLSANSGFANGFPVFQSPFDPAGTGPTSPLIFLSNFNVQVSGQNAIYNIQRYSFEQFNNQLMGQNSVNGGLTDGLCSGLIGRTQFDMEYCYYYVNLERMLPVEETVPKSIQILGTNLSGKALDLYCFIEYGNEVRIDALTGARV